MAIVYSQDVVEIAVVAELAGRPHVNVMHIKNDEGSQSDVAKVRDFANNWQDHMLGFISIEYVLKSFEWRSLDPDDSNVGTLAPDAAKNVTGLVAGDVESPNVSLLIHKRTLNRPRGRRDGRLFLGGVPTIHTFANGNLTTTLTDAANTALTAFVDGVNDTAWAGGAGGGLVVLETTPASRVPGTTPVTIGSRAVIQMVCDTRAATQRDRLR